MLSSLSSAMCRKGNAEAQAFLQSKRDAVANAKNNLTVVSAAFETAKAKVGPEAHLRNSAIPAA